MRGQARRGPISKRSHTEVVNIRCQHSMVMDSIRQILDTWRDPARAERIGQALAALLTESEYQKLLTALRCYLPENPDPDRALNNLERYFAAHPSAVKQLLRGESSEWGVLLRLLGTSQFFADVLVADPESSRMLHVPLRCTPGPSELQRELREEVARATDDVSLLRAFRRFRRRHFLRIGTNDIIHDRTLEEITQDISDVADAVISVALETAWERLVSRFGEPRGPEGQTARCVVLAFGKLGGRELNYSSDIDLMLIYDVEGSTSGRACLSNDEFFARVVSELVRLLATHTESGQAYRVDLRLRPEGRRGPLARSLASTLGYYESLGRTWERQALIKVRPVAGDLNLGAAFLQSVTPFIYHRYLGFAEIHEIKALKRRIEQRVRQAGADETDVKLGIGGIRDIEFAVQFLQLLHGASMPQLREANTLRALQVLESAGCLTPDEFTILDKGYRFLRRVEHRLQLLFDLQTHRLPESTEELDRLARRMGYKPRRESVSSARPALRINRSLLDDAPPVMIDTRDLLVEPLDAFLHDWCEKTRLNRQVLDHLLHGTFVEVGDSEGPESDLILDPEPPPALVHSVMQRYRFRDPESAYRNLCRLAEESVPFLSTPRCRHFLASVAPALLRALSQTPDPDQTLNNLEQVTSSLGAKAVLWELFRFSPPSLQLTIDLCAGSQFLTDILINNPGMVDDLLDSLVLNRPRTRAELDAELTELCRGATDVEPILHSFQDKEWLRIGVGDLLGKTPIQETTAALSDLAETLLSQVVHRLVQQHPPPAPFVVLGLGKLGGREMSYHSDLDLVLLYDDGPGEHLSFFTELVQQIIRTLSQPGAMGRLYKVDLRLRPTGGAGYLATPFAEFRRYFTEGVAQLWERQALMRARVIVGDAALARNVDATVRELALGSGWQPRHAVEIRTMRERVEQSRSERDVKRGRGGQADVEFLLQLLQLKYGRTYPELLQTNTWLVLAAAHATGLLSREEWSDLQTGYDFLRRVESRVRLMTNRALDEFPEAIAEQEKLAQRLRLADAAEFRAILQQHRERVRELLDRVVRRESRD